MKKLISSLLVLMVLLSTTTTAFASRSSLSIQSVHSKENLRTYTITTYNGNSIDVNINNSILNLISDKDILDLAATYANDPSVGAITVYAVSTAIYESTSTNSTDSSISPNSENGVHSKVTYDMSGGSKKETVAGDYFVTSAARGQTTKLSSTWSRSISLSLTGSPLSSSSLGLKSKVTKTYSASTTFTGPSESSPYNSREFRVKFYKHTGSWQQWRETVNGTQYDRKSGSFSAPARCASYSIDRKE